MPARYKRGGKHSNQFIKAREQGQPVPRGPKATFTDRRWNNRQQFWRPIALAARYHILFGPKGTAARMAEATGIAQSQIHRFTCPECEHDQEGSFSVGMAILLYLATYNYKQSAIDIQAEAVALRRMYYDPKSGDLEIEKHNANRCQKI